MLNIAIDGSSGFIASNLISFLHSKTDLCITAYTKKNNLIKHESISYRNYNIEDEEDLEGLDYIIYCSYKFNTSDNYNVERLNLLLNKIKNLKVKIIYLSSCNANRNSNTPYSKDKIRCENILNRYDQIIIKVPTVILKKSDSVLMGGQGKSLINIIKLAKVFKFFPLVDNGAFDHNYCMMDDLIKIIYLLINKEINKNIIIIKNNNSISFKLLMKHVLEINKLYYRFIPIPNWFLKIFLWPTKYIPSSRISAYDSLIDLISNNSLQYDEKFLLEKFNYKKITD